MGFLDTLQTSLTLQPYNGGSIGGANTTAPVDAVAMPEAAGGGSIGARPADIFNSLLNAGINLGTTALTRDQKRLSAKQSAAAAPVSDPTGGQARLLLWGGAALVAVLIVFLVMRRK